MSIAIAVPPRDEQHRLMATVQDETTTLRIAIDRARREITLLREHRTRPVADVVTGKLDLRAAAASLPDEADEPEAEGDSDARAEGDKDTTNGDLDSAPE